MAQKKKPIKLHRKQKRQITGLTLIILVAAIMAIVMLTPAFDIKKIKVYGNSVVDEKDIVQSSSIVTGVNIFGVSLKKAKDNIEKMGYIESVNLRRVLPSTIEITVVEEAGVAYIAAKNGYVTITADGRSIDVINPDKIGKEQNETEKYAPEYPIIKGIKNITYKVGKKIKSEDTKRLDVLFECLREFSKNGYVFNMTYIDLEDLSDIRFGYNKNKLEVSLGSCDKIDYKMECFGPILQNIGSDAEGYIDLQRLIYKNKKTVSNANNE